MTRLARLLTVVGILLLIFGIRLGAEDWSKVYTQVVRDHLVVIDIALEGHRVYGNCSGVVIGPNQVLTAAHCLLEPTLPAQTGYVRGKKVHILKVGQADLVLLDADTKGKRSILIPFIGSKPGTPVAAIGQAGSDPHPSISPMAIVTTQNGFVYTNNTLFKGWSGGPLVTLQGHLAGIMVATNLEWGFALSVDIATIRAFLQAPDNQPSAKILSQPVEAIEVR